MTIAKRRKSLITREGMSYLFMLAFILVGAVLRQMNLMIGLASMMIGLCLLNWRLSLAMLRGMKLWRQFPQHVCAGDVFSVDIMIQNMRRRVDGWALRIQDQVAEWDDDRAVGATRIHMLVSHVATGNVERATYRCCFQHRGRYRFGPLLVATRFPFGLVRAWREFDVRETLIVLPRLGHLRPSWQSIAGARTSGAQPAPHMRGLIRGEYYGLRDWQAGDTRRSVHWRATAKLGSLKVCEYERQRDQQLALVVDLWKPDKENDQQTENVETAISLAATALTQACRSGSQRITLAISGQSADYLSAPASVGFLYEGLEQLALAQPVPSGPLNELITQVMRDVGKADHVVVVSTRARPSTTAGQDADGQQLMALESRAGQVTWIDVSSDQLARYFELSSNMPPLEDEQLDENSSTTPEVAFA